MNTTVRGGLRAIPLALAFLHVSPSALAGEGDFAVVSVYKTEDGWVGRINDGETTLETSPRSSKKKAREAAQSMADSANADGCVDPCIFDPGGCGPGGLAATGADWEIAGGAALPDGAFEVTLRNDAGASVILVRSTQQAALTDGQSTADGLNAGTCVALP